MTILHFVFVLVAFFAVYIQTKSYALAGQPQAQAEYRRLLRVRRVVSPGIAGLAALIVAYGSLVLGNATLFMGLLLTGVWVFASLGDIFIEGSYSTTNADKKARYYILGMVLFIVFTLGLGIGLVVQGIFIEQVALAGVLAAAAGALVMGMLAYRTLEVAPENRAVVLVYTVSVTVLLWGGLLMALAGQVHLAYIGCAYFVSDWCVGLRDFGKHVPPLLQRNLLIVILMLYYSIMLVAIDFVL